MGGSGSSYPAAQKKKKKTGEERRGRIFGISPLFKPLSAGDVNELSTELELTKTIIGSSGQRPLRGCRVGSGCPLLTGIGSVWGGDCAAPQNFFLYFQVKNAGNGRGLIDPLGAENVKHTGG